MKKKSFRMFFRSLLTKFGQMTTDKATLVWDGEGELEVGMEVYVESGEEDQVEYIAPEDGEYTADNGDVIVVKDGKVDEIRKAEEGESEEEAPAEDAAPTEENMEGEGGEAAEAAPAVEDIVAPEEPAFDAEEACRMLAEEVAAMKAEIQALRDQVNSLLEVPVEEDAFSKQKKVVKSEFKAFMKCK